MEHAIILFFVTFSASLMGFVPPGLLNLTAARISTKKGRHNGIMFSAGASVTVSLQAYLAVLISRYLYNNPLVIDLLLKIALIVFAFFAVYFFVLARKNKEKKIHFDEVENTGRRNSFFKGLFMAVLNVLPIPYFSALNAAWNVSGWIKFEIIDILIFTLAAGLGAFAMFYMYAVFFTKVQSRSRRFSKYSDYILSVLMLVLLVITLIRIFYGE